MYWDKFGIPQTIPRRGTSSDYWWFDPAKERTLAARDTMEPAGTEDAGEGGLSTAVTTLIVGLLLFFGYLSFRRFGGRTAG